MGISVFMDMSLAIVNVIDFFIFRQRCLWWYESIKTVVEYIHVCNDDCLVFFALCFLIIPDCVVSLV